MVPDRPDSMMTQKARGFSRKLITKTKRFTCESWPIKQSMNLLPGSGEVACVRKLESCIFFGGRRKHGWPIHSNLLNLDGCQELGEKICPSTKDSCHEAMLIESSD